MMIRQLILVTRDMEKLILLFCRIPLLCTLIAMHPLCLAQAPNEPSFQEEFEQFTRDANEQFSQFRDTNDAEYVNWLSETWRNYEMFRGMVRDPTPKIDDIPTVQGAEQGRFSQKPKEKQKKTARGGAVDKSIHAKIIGNAEKAQSSWGVLESVSLSSQLNADLFEPANSSDIATLWTRLASSNYPKIVTELKLWQQRYQLSDWATLRLLVRVAHLHTMDVESQKVMVWFLSTKLGLNIIGGFSSDQVILLFASQQKVFEKPYYRIHGQNFYVIDGAATSGELQLPPKSYPVSLEPLDLRFANSFTNVKPHVSTKLRRAGQTFEIPLIHDRLNLFNSYPQIDLIHYFEAPLSRATSEELSKGLGPSIQNLSTLAQINWLLNWVQNSFDYQLDHAQFGGENYLHPEESLFLQSNDCEDRAFLFSWLVKNLVGVPVVGITYPGHVATAVALEKNEDLERAPNFNYKGTDYWVADPTYIGANVGQIMPQFRKATPVVINLQ